MCLKLITSNVGCAVAPLVVEGAPGARPDSVAYVLGGLVETVQKLLPFARWLAAEIFAGVLETGFPARLPDADPPQPKNRHRSSPDNIPGSGPIPACGQQSTAPARQLDLALIELEINQVGRFARPGQQLFNLIVEFVLRCLSG